ncbi:DUF2334 domain-containing protein [Nocardia stercoris]|uniref:DUF2334 domain-containing protein n=2 Tax=Nocardia stercoris TaxID=2483361 RepID=A0A3M2L8M3_9NOCA|nr:DUF2334 domain-containing protein [Nocardia stercoris]
MSGGRPGLFHVSVLDVAPVWASEIAEILDAVQPMIGTSLSAAVVPCWGGEPFTAADAGIIVGRADELLLHGYRHRRVRGTGVISVTSGGIDEFAGLDRDEAETALRDGLDLLGDALGVRIDGFLPPGYRFGAVDEYVLAAAGLRYRVGWASAADVDGCSIRLATRIPNMSRFTMASRAGAVATRIAALRTGAVPTVVLRPADVWNRTVGDAVGRIRSLTARGFRPALIRDLLAESDFR